MADLITTAQMMDESKFYFVPIRSDMPRDVARLTGVISFAQINFCQHFRISDDFIDNTEKLEALKYWTFAVWQSSQRFGKTQQGTAVDPKLLKGDTTYDLQKEVDCLNAAITLMNKFLDEKVALILPFFNY